MYRQTILLTLAAAPTLLPGLEPNRPQVQATFHQSYSMQAGSKLTVNNLNGSIEISGWDQNTLDVSATKYAETQELLAQLKIDVSVASGGVLIRTIPPSESGNVGVKYVIKVPRRAELTEIRSSNGSIHINEIEGDANLRTSNGAVHAERTHGKLEIATSNGAVEVQNIEGETDVRTSNGGVRASGIRGPLVAMTSNGGMRVDLEDSRGGAVRLTTTNGGVDLKLGAAAPSDVNASTSNGSITVRLPASAGARVKAETSRNSRISSDFEVQKEGENTPSRLEGVVGSGGPQLHLTTSHGSIQLVKL
jgi:DUF4097 and DUF4098 domain-containing protein YvlB